MGARRSKRRAGLEEAVLTAGRLVSQAAVLYHSKVAAHFGLNATDMKALDLIQSTGPLTPAELAERMGFAPASVTAMVDRLEAKALLRRVPHPTDGRRLLVEFDPSAVRRLAPVYAPFFSSLAELLAGYSDAELELIERAFSEIAARQMAAASALEHDEAPVEAGE